MVMVVALEQIRSWGGGGVFVVVGGGGDGVACWC